MWDGTHAVGVERAALLAFPNDDVVDEQSDKRALLVQAEVVPCLGCDPLERRSVNVRVGDQPVELLARDRETLLDRILRVRSDEPAAPTGCRSSG